LSSAEVAVVHNATSVTALYPEDAAVVHNAPSAIALAPRGHVSLSKDS